MLVRTLAPTTLLLAISLLTLACDKREDKRADVRSDRRPDALAPSPFIETADDPRSTFSIDVDTAAYAQVRRALLDEGRLPAAELVRTEELINYFDYDYPQPRDQLPFSLTTEVGPCPWNPDHRLVHVGVQGERIASDQAPARNLVFLLDVSGSMRSRDRLPLVAYGLGALIEQLNPADRVAIVVYAGAAGVVLPPTSGANKQAIRDAIDRLEAGGSTNGGAGIELAYALAEQNFEPGGVNRVVLATDGDFNVGVTSQRALIELIEAKRETGVYLSVLGVGAAIDDVTMEQLADHGNGNYAYLDGKTEARKVLVAEAGATLVTIAKDVKIQVEFDPAQVAAHRLIGYENRVLAHHEFEDDEADAGEIGAGHSVTAIYEITPTAAAEPGRSLLELRLRYQRPHGDAPSEAISLAVHDGGQTLADSSNDFRFAAAVAAFAERLRGNQSPRYADILALAEGSLGHDAHCHRQQFLELVQTAAALAGEPVEPSTARCAVAEVEPVAALARTHGDTPPWDRPGFWFEVLAVLPAFLVLPMFVSAHRKRLGRKA